MTATTDRRPTATPTTRSTRTTASVDPKPQSPWVTRAMVALRLAFAFEFLWAFFDKTFGLGFATPSERSWLNGGSPTNGFLSNSAEGPFAGFYTSIAGATWADWMFMIGLFAIGAALLFGVGIRIAAISGAVLLVMMWSVALPPATNPVIDSHIIEALALLLLATLYAGDKLGFGQWWARTSIVQSAPYLR